MKIIEQYLNYLQERQWDDETPNPEAFDRKLYADVIGNLSGIKQISKTYQTNQPTLFSLYFKNVLGDYKGRPWGLNVKRSKKHGLDDIGKEKDRIKKVEKMEKDLDPHKDRKNFIKQKSSKRGLDDPTPEFDLTSGDSK